MTAPAVAISDPALAVHRSRKLIPDFRLHRPRSTAEAVAIKAACGPGAVFMAGGIDVVNRLKYSAAVTDVIHLAGVPGLDRIEQRPDAIRLGALVTHEQLATATAVRKCLPALAQTWPDVANIRIRCKGTLGGNLMAGDPSYDFALAALAAGARLHFLTQDGDTEIAASDLAPADALLAAIDFPLGVHLALDRSLRPIVTVVLGLDLLPDGRVASGRVAVGCAFDAPVAMALPIAEALTPDRLASAAGAIAQKAAAAMPVPRSDHHAGSGYRRRMIELLLRRLLEAAA